MVVAIINGVFDIIERHQASGATEPLTREQVQAQLNIDLDDGDTIIAREFLRLGLTPPK